MRKARRRALECSLHSTVLLPAETPKGAYAPSQPAKGPPVHRCPVCLHVARIKFRLAIAAFLAVGAVTGSLARPGPQWADQPIAVREWFQSLRQPDQPAMSCCGEADAFEADAFEVEGDHYIAIITGGKGAIPNGTRISVPNKKMKWDAGNPTGHGIIFIGSSGQVYCYVAPGGV
jgi:hypothetical protein